MFAGGGAIPLEAMRLGCEVTAVDINPVAWFILKCTLEYPQRLANQYRPLPDFACQSREFMESYFKAKGFKGAALEVQLTSLGLPMNQASQPQLIGIQTKVSSVEADLAWHIRAWGWWVLQQARADLAPFYPIVDNKPTVAYLWARTVSCKNCRATVPLLKTRWPSKKNNKRVVLTMEPNANKTGVVFGVQNDAPSLAKGSAAQKREHDKKMAGGTMSRSGVTCPCCSTIMTMEYLRSESIASRTSAVLTAVVVEGENGKEYRVPVEEEISMATDAEKELASLYAEIPFGLPVEPLPGKEALGFRVPLYGFDKWYKLFTPRQLLAIGTFVKYTRAVREVMQKQGYPPQWVEAVGMYLATSVDRLIDHSTSLATWYLQGENVKHTFVRYALPIIWDFAETNTLYAGGGSWASAVNLCSAALEQTLQATSKSLSPTIILGSATHEFNNADIDVIVTDPPYYDAIPYADLMDLFYVWLRRSIYDLGSDFEHLKEQPLTPKWNKETNDGELIDDSSRFEGDKTKSKTT